MNSTYKVVFNKVRGALMVVNEVTSSVQAKGTKTVVAAAVAALVAGAAGAAEWVDAPEDLTPVSEAGSWDKVPADVHFKLETQGSYLSENNEITRDFAGNLWVTGSGASGDATGIYATDKATVLNSGNIYVSTEKDAKNWKTEGILVDGNAKAVNEGAIVAKNAYGMRFGTTYAEGEKAELINNGTIDVLETGVGIELGITTNKDIKAVNTGTIRVGDVAEGGFGHGVLIQDQIGGTFVNHGNIIAGKGASAIEVKGNTEGAIIELRSGQIDGKINVGTAEGSNVTGTDIKALGYQGELDIASADTDFAFTVADGANVTLKDGNKAVYGEVAIENARLNASIWKDDNDFDVVTVEKGGIFNVTKLNSDSDKDKQNDTLLIKDSTWNLNGGRLQVVGVDYHGPLKVGTASTTGTLNTNGNYSFSTLEVAKQGAVNVFGDLTVGTLNFSDGKTDNLGLVKVNEGGSLTVNDKLSLLGKYTSNKVGENGLYVYGDLTLGSDVELAITENSITIQEGGELHAAQGQIFTLEEDSYKLTEDAAKIGFEDGSALFLSDVLTMTQEEFTGLLGKLQASLKDADIVYENLKFDGNVTFDTALGYNTYKTAVDASGNFDAEGKITTLSMDSDAGVGALKVAAGTETVEVSGDGELLISGMGGNVFEGVDMVKTLAVDGNLALGWDENSKGVLNAQDVTVDDLSVSGHFTAKNVTLRKGDVDGYFKLDTLLSNGGEGQDDKFTVKEGGTLEVRQLAIDTTVESGATLVLGDRMVKEVVATRAPEDDVQYEAQIQTELEVKNLDAVVTTNANGRNLLRAVAGEAYDPEVNVGLYVDDTIAVDRTNGKLIVGELNNPGEKGMGTISIGKNAVAVIDLNAFSGDKAVFDASQLHVNNEAEMLFTGADRIKTVKLIEDGTTGWSASSIDLNNVWLTAGTEVKEGDTYLNLAFNQQATNDEDMNRFAESVLTTGSESLGVVNAIGQAYATDEGTLSDAGMLAMDEYLALPIVAGTYNAAYDAAEQVWGSVTKHNLERGMKGHGIWADVFYASNEAKSIYADGYGYEADIYGGVLGYDFMAECGGKLGIALTVGTADADSRGTTAGKFQNDADFWGLSIYGSKDIGQKLVASADITYLSLDNDIKGSIAGADIGESIDSSVISVGLRADWKAYESQSFEIVPHVGLRYAQIDVDDYRELSSDSLDVFEAPVGVAFNGKFEAAGWKFVPTVDFTAVPQLGDKDVPDYYGDKIDVLDNVYNTTLGISAETGNFTFGLYGRYGFGTDDRSNASVNANVSYRF